MSSLKHPVTWTESNVRKLINGHPILLKKHQLDGPHFVMVHPVTHKRMQHAKTKGTGLRLALTPLELQQTIEGGGFGDIWNKIKSGAQWVKKNIIDSNIYQQDIKPIVKKAVQAATAAVTPMLGPVAPLAETAINKVGEVTGAYGLEMVHKPKAKKSVQSKPRAKKATKGGSIYLN